MIFLGIAGAAGLVAGAATRHILRWHSSPLKNNFFVTPLYIIETNLERIQFWPLWEIIDINATHHHTNGRYDNTELRLRLRSEWRSWRISSKQEFDVLMQLLDSFRSQLGQHSRAGDWEYFSTHDDFQGMGDNDRVAAPPPRINWFVTALPGLVFLVALIISGGLNRADAPNRWFYHESQPPEVAKLPTSLSSLQTPAILAPLEDAAIPPAEAIPMNPAAVPIPSTYTVRQGDSLAKIAADVGIDIEELIRANPSITSPDLLLVGAELNIPTTKRNTAPISMAESSPSVPKPEPRIPLDLKVDESSQVSSPTKQAVHLPQPLPMHGSVTRYSTAEAIAPLSIKTSLGSGYYYVKLVAWPSGKPELVVFVHGGRDVSVEVPLGEYRMKYANGTDWYGENYLFGERTTYSEAESLFAFTVEGNQISGYTVELILQEQGNLVTNSIPAQAF
jgi:LysM repeat protein